MLSIVMLERDNVGEDIDLSKFEKLGDVVIYGQTRKEQIRERIQNADIVILNKMPMNEETMKDALKLKLLCVTATGTDNVDSEYCAKRNIIVKNVKGYSTDTVVQHTFAMALYLIEKLPFYDAYVKEGDYIKSPTFSFFGEHFMELAHKTWGIVGLGEIGRKVAQLAELLGCNVIYYSTSGIHEDDQFERVCFDELLKQSDIISIHAPLNVHTRGLFNQEAFHKMKPEAYLINVGRGPIVCEQDLFDALTNDVIAGAALDVLSVEPMTKENPLYQMKDSKKLLITPHIAWASTEARVRLMDCVYENVSEFVQKTVFL